MVVDGKIELQDWMFDVYCKMLVCQILQYVYFEVVGMLLEGNWILCVLSLKCKVILFVKVQDEVGYGFYFYSVVEMFGVLCDLLIDVLYVGKVKYLSIFNYLMLIWVDVGVIGWLVDGVVIMNQILLCCCIYGLYVCVMICVCKEELFYQCQGFDVLLLMMKGSDVQCVMVQQVVDCWWWLVLMMFGLSDVDLVYSSQFVKWGIKWILNDDLCQKFVDVMVDQVKVFGVMLFDFDLKWNEVCGYYDYGVIDWDEFWCVVNGDGLCNKECFVMCVKVYEDGVWVCEVVFVYEVKCCVCVEQQVV